MIHKRSQRFGVRTAGAALMVLALAGCDNILEVNDPDIVTPESLASDLGLQTIRNGALGNFTIAVQGGGSTDGQLMISGLFTDEWMHSGTFTTRFRTETRNIDLDNGTLTGVYFRLQQARVALENAADRLNEVGGDPATDDRIPEMLTYAGYTYLSFGENYCSGVPFSKQPDSGPTEFGNPETTTEIFNRAIARFDAALAHGAIASDIADMARVGKGRAQLDLGNFSGAAATVASVADDFAKFSRHSSNSGGERNSIFELNVSVGRWSVGDTEGGNGLDFRTSGDPRIQTSLCAGCAFDNSAQVPGTPAIGDNWMYDNMPNREQPIPLATGIEARLIEAEAMLQSGNAAGWLAELNGLRAQWSSLASIVNGDGGTALAPLADPGTATGREDLHFRERAFWLYSTGHRLGDVRRMARQYGRNPNTILPTGTYWKAGADYGTDVNLPVPTNEENNPNFSACIDRNP